MVVVVIENAARPVDPVLVKEAIDTGIPPIRESGDLGRSCSSSGSSSSPTITQAVSRNLFLCGPALGQDVLLSSGGGFPPLPAA